MEGAIVVSGFLHGRKYEEPAMMVARSAEERGIGLRVVRNTELAFPIGDADAARRVLGESGFVVFWDKDVRSARNLELCGYRCFNSSECIATCDDKSATHMALAENGVPSLRTISCPTTFSNVGYTDTGFLDEAAGFMGFPIVVKDCFGSFGMQVRLARDMDELRMEVSRDPGPKILQEYIECGSSDVRVEVVGGRGVAAMSRKGPEGDFRSNCTIGGTMTCHEPTHEERELACRAAEAVGADFCGVDMILTADGPRVCEVNSNAHIRNLLDCTGIDVSANIVEHIVEMIR